MSASDMEKFEILLQKQDKECNRLFNYDKKFFIFFFYVFL
ncbi:hypothetical protein BvCmsNSNP012_05006 [Escherichia coli]|nr:hypothetical protein BvCmsNSNP012_05006 [Escherichia coli]